MVTSTASLTVYRRNLEETSLYLLAIASNAPPLRAAAVAQVALRSPHLEQE